MEASPTETCSPQASAPPTGSSLSPPGNLCGEIAGLRRLLLDALEGISFLSDEVSQMREENERLRKDHSRVAEQQARIVASLRSEVRFLREELARRVNPAPAKSPTVVCDPLNLRQPLALRHASRHRDQSCLPYAASSSIPFGATR